MTPADAILYGFIGGGLFMVALLVVLLLVAKVTNQRAAADWSQFIDGMVSADMTGTRTNGIAPDERDGDGGKND